MKRSIIILFALLSLPILLLAQSQQQVVVREYREKAQKTPLGGVSLTVQNAASAMSNGQGEVILQFRTLKAGDQVQVRRVDLAGYEVFNQEAVDQWTISPQKPFSLVLCRSEHLWELRNSYMLVASNSYALKYKQDQARLAALRQQNQLQEEAYQQQLVELENAYNEQLDQLDNYVDRFARIDLSELSAQEQQLVEMVQRGEMDKAIELYESADYLKQYSQQVSDLKEIDRAQATLAKVEAEKLAARDKVQQAIGRQVQTYRLAGGQENYRKISALLKGVADADTTNLSALRDYCTHCLTQNMMHEGETYMNIYLRQCRDHKELQAYACLDMGRLLALKYEFDLAVQYEEKALALARECVAEDRERFLPMQTLIQSTLHTLYIFINQPAAALAFSEELRTNLEASENEDRLDWTLASFYGEYGYACYMEMADTEKAEELMLRSYTLTKGIAEREQYSYESEVYLIDAISYLNQLFYYTQQWNKMEPYMREALAMREEQYKKNEDATARYLYEVYVNTSELCYNLDKLSEAHKYMDKALDLLPQLSALFDEQTLYADKMNLYDVASQLYHKEGDTEQSRHYATLCLELYEQIPEEMKPGLEELVQRNQKYLK